MTVQGRLFLTQEAGPSRTVGRTVDASELAAATTALAEPSAAESWLLVGGDSFDLAVTLPPESIDLILTSPPYWGHRSYGRDHNWEICTLWRELGHPVEETPPYEWYRQQGGVLGLEPVPWPWERLVSYHASVSRMKASSLLGAQIFGLRGLSDVSHLPVAKQTR